VKDEAMTEVYLVCWDIRRSATVAERKRFYRFLRKTLGEAYPGSRVLDSLLEVGDSTTAVKIYRAALEIGDVRLYRATRISSLFINSRVQGPRRSMYICSKCGNTGPGAFRFDARTGDIRCRRCGAVAEFVHIGEDI